MTINDIEKSLLQKQRQNAELSNMVQKAYYEKRANDLYTLLCHCIAKSRISLREGGRCYDPSNDTAEYTDSYRVFLLTGSNKRKSCPIEYLVKTNTYDFFDQESNQTFMDKLSTSLFSDKYHPRRHYRYSSTDKWHWFTSVFHPLMEKERINYEWVYITEKAFQDEKTVLKSNYGCKPLPKTGSYSFDEAGYQTAGTVYIHVWYDA